MSWLEPPKLPKQKFGTSTLVFEMPLHPAIGVNFQLPFNRKDGNNTIKFDVDVSPLERKVSIKTIRRFPIKSMFRRNRYYTQKMTERVEELVTPQQKINIFSDEATYDITVDLDAKRVTVKVDGEKFIYW